MLLFIVLLISKNFKINYLLELFLITFITLIKSYTVFLFIGLITKSLLYKEYKKSFFVATVFMVINILVLFSHYFLNSSLLPEPISFTRTFGVIHDYKIVTSIYWFDEAMIVVFMLVSFLVLFRSKLENIHTILNTSDTETINKLIVLMPFLFFY